MATLKKKNLVNLKCLFWFSLQLLSATLLTQRNEQDIIINAQGMWSIRYSCQILIKLEFCYNNINSQIDATIIILLIISIITAACGWLFILLYQWCTVTKTSNWILLTDFRKILNQISRKSVQWEPSCSTWTHTHTTTTTHKHTDGQTWRSQ